MSGPTLLSPVIVTPARDETASNNTLAYHFNKSGPVSTMSHAVWFVFLPYFLYIMHRSYLYIIKLTL